jgi:TRAP-type mannitol/chloroaromatic compound transport system permease small subunit
MVPLPSVVVVVVVVSDTCVRAHANGAANAMLDITFFIFPFLSS